MDYFVWWLLFLLIVIFYYNRKDIIAPSVIFTLSFFLSGAIFSLNSLVWEYDLSFKTKITIVSGILTFFAGCVIGNLFRLRVSYKGDRNIIFTLKNKNVFLFLSICLLLPLLRLMDIIVSVGSLNLDAYHDYEGQNVFGVLLKIASPICNALSIILIYSIISNKFQGIRIKKIQILPILSFFIATVLSSNRIEMLYTFIYFFVIYFLIYKVKRNQNIHAYHILLFSFLSIIVFAIFYGLGYLTGKSQNFGNGGISYISYYAASSFPAFDMFLDKFVYDISNFGTETFSGLTSLGSWLGLDIDYVENRSKEFVKFSDMTSGTNVYTCFRSLLHDFDYLGMYIILFFEGLLFQIIYRKSIIECRQGGIFWVILYAYSCAFIMLSSILERIFASFLTLTTLMFVFSVNFLRNLFIKVYVIK